MPQTLLITGGTGYLGHHLIQQACSWITHATFFQAAPPSSSTAVFHQCDLTAKDQVHRLITSIQPSVIIHTACSNKSSQEIESIVSAAHHIATIAQDRSIKLLHLSTDLVFDGSSAPYREEDHPKPLHRYGHAKVEAEQLIRTICPMSVIVRSSLIYGIRPPDHQTRWLLQGMEKGEAIRLFTDEIRSPIWVKSLAHALLELASIDYHGFLHIAGPESLNRWDFGMAILQLLQRDPTSNIHSSTIAESGMIRPKNLALTIDRSQKLLKTPLLSIAEVMQELHRV